MNQMGRPTSLKMLILSQVLNDEKTSVLSTSQVTSQKLDFGKLVCESFSHLRRTEAVALRCFVKKVFRKVRKIHRKTLVLESLF